MLFMNMQIKLKYFVLLRLPIICLPVEAKGKEQLSTLKESRVFFFLFLKQKYYRFRQILKRQIVRKSYSSWKLKGEACILFICARVSIDPIKTFLPSLSFGDNCNSNDDKGTTVTVVVVITTAKRFNKLFIQKKRPPATVLIIDHPLANHIHLQQAWRPTIWATKAKKEGNIWERRQIMTALRHWTG
ncbi:unnamed protein product [Wuchereria bancrofti]|uniref:Secreted protein n=2 Tax=Wuchereria bancrofti TaxID=6293 RepID=A0A3P7DBA5_WUCBA|nr:unnamed protein product [Wuchereria bancrofti]